MEVEGKWARSKVGREANSVVCAKKWLARDGSGSQDQMGRGSPHGCGNLPIVKAMGLSLCASIAAPLVLRRRCSIVLLRARSYKSPG